jgi:hypothetical protein
MGAFRFYADNTFNFGVGGEAVDRLYLLLKVTPPQKHEAEDYPVMVNINGVKDTLNFHGFTTWDLMVIGHYYFRISPMAKVHPTFYGGLGLHYLYNSGSVSGEEDVRANGIGPEFGLGAMWEMGKNFSSDFTFSVKFPYYNEYKREGESKVAVGLDEQVISFNFSLYYTVDLVKADSEK